MGFVKDTALRGRWCWHPGAFSISKHVIRRRSLAMESRSVRFFSYLTGQLIGTQARYC